MMLDQFQMALLRFVYVPEETVLMPVYKGNVLRGGFGAALKNVACALRRAECDKCMLKSNCAYSQIFETPVPDDSKYLEGRQFAPHPFALEPPLETKTSYDEDDEISFQLLLVGKAIGFTPYFVLAFHILGQWGLGKRIQGQRGRCFLHRVESISADGEPCVIYTGESEQFSAEYHVITGQGILESSEGVEADSVALEFLTPARIKSNGRFRDNIDFEMLIRALLRRIMTLSYFHCGQELELDYRGLVERARQNVRKVGDGSHWHDWSRYSRRQDTRLMMGGIRGRVAFEGDLHEFMPLLLLGEYVHVGKGTAFGLGKYSICSR